MKGSLILLLLVLYCGVFVFADGKLGLVDINPLMLGLVVAGLLLCAFVEELIFRQLPIIWDGGKWPTTLLFALFFALVHVSNAGFFFFASINTFLIALVLSVVRLEHGLWACTWVHFVWNAIAVVMFDDVLSGLKLYELFGIDRSYSFFALDYERSIWFGASYGLENSPLLTLMLVFLLGHKFAWRREGAISWLNVYRTS